jgi:hypothetical protein
MIQFCWGATTLACWTVALLFLRHWLASRDRFFAFFAAAFAILGANWLALAVVDPANEARHLVYLLRIAAFTTIIIGVIDKNRTAPRG